MYIISDNDAHRVAEAALQVCKTQLPPVTMADMFAIGHAAFASSQLLMPKADPHTVFQALDANGEDFSNHDLAVISDWAHKNAKEVPNPDWKRAYALIREGADLLLRRRARSSVEPGILRYEDEPIGLNHQSKDSVYIASNDGPITACNVTALVQP